jgi:hypothetical protein
MGCRQLDVTRQGIAATACCLCACDNSSECGPDEHPSISLNAGYYFELMKSTIFNAIRSAHSEMGSGEEI